MGLNNMETNEKSKKKIQLQTFKERIYSWMLQRELTWGVVVLTCLTGLIQLLSIPEKSNFWYLASSSAMYVALSSILAYSLFYFSKLYRYSREVLASEFSDERLKRYLESSRGIHSSLLGPKMSKIISIISFFVLLIAWLSKIGYLS